MSIAAIGYLRFSATNPDAFLTFCTDVIGLMDVENQDNTDTRLLRMDKHPFRFMVEAGESDGLSAFGLEARTRQQWEQMVEGLASAGYEYKTGSGDAAARRCVTEFVSFDDPSGNTVELYYGRKLDYQPFNSPAGVRRFITADDEGHDMGFGHVVVPAVACDETVQFYTERLGLGISDVLSLAQPPSKVVFMHAANPRQHSLALYDQPSPVGVVHVMVEVGSLDEVGLALDRAQAAGHPIIASLGRHINDNMCSFYVLAPGGIAFEYGYDGLQIKDWENYTPTESTEGDLWGHAYSFPAPPEGN